MEKIFLHFDSIASYKPWFDEVRARIVTLSRKIESTAKHKPAELQKVIGEIKEMENFAEWLEPAYAKLCAGRVIWEVRFLRSMDFEFRRLNAYLQLEILTRIADKLLEITGSLVHMANS